MSPVVAESHLVFCFRAKLAKSSADWPWSSGGQAQLPEIMRVNLQRVPALAREDWRAWVDRPQTAAEEAAMTRCINQSRPFGDDDWLETMKKKLRRREPLKRGRPRKKRK